MEINFEKFITGVEIKQQPRLWKEMIEIIEGKLGGIKNFLTSMNKKNIRVIFTGAGTSEFIGKTIVPYLNKKSEFKIESIATTDIVSNPELYLNKEEATILISCARSGNSPESIAAVNLAEKLVDNIFHIFLTCNKEGHLAKLSYEKEKILLILMPEKSNDKGFAMTGSFTSICLAGICLFSLDEIEEVKNNIKKISLAIKQSFLKIYTLMDEVTDREIKRVVCLGDGALKGTAQEGSLKILELSSGNISISYDSSLGFRHGPKSVITDNTLIIMFMSNNGYTRKYQLDLLKELKKDGGEKKVLVLDNDLDPEVQSNSDYYFTYFSKELSKLNDVFSNFGYIYIVQIYAYLKSFKLGINPDNPCPTGEVNRVVQGVTLYEYFKN